MFANNFAVVICSGGHSIGDKRAEDGDDMQGLPGESHGHHSPQLPPFLFMLGLCKKTGTAKQYADMSHV